MQGFEALNSTVTRFAEDLTRGLSSIGIPNGQQKAVRYPFTFVNDRHVMEYQ